MSNTDRSVLGLVSVLAALAAVPNFAQADTRAGFAGRPETPVDASAFYLGFSAIGGVFGFGLSNISSAPKTWLIDLPVNACRTYTVSVRAVEDGSTSGWLSCYPVVIGPDGQSVAGGSGATSSDTTGYQNITMTSAVVPAGGILYVGCQMSSNSSAKILSVDWY